MNKAFRDWLSDLELTVKCERLIRLSLYFVEDGCCRKEDLLENTRELGYRKDIVEVSLEALILEGEVVEDGPLLRLSDELMAEWDNRPRSP